MRNHRNYCYVSYLTWDAIYIQANHVHSARVVYSLSILLMRKNDAILDRMRYKEKIGEISGLNLTMAARCNYGCRNLSSLVILIFQPHQHTDPKCKTADNCLMRPLIGSLFDEAVVWPPG